ncbi:MAG: TPM domain-containing protein [Oscillospiraceae bacterium]|nr:TPM domain-containing protein [Oscillospiraceae bacterium]
MKRIAAILTALLMFVLLLPLQAAAVGGTVVDSKGMLPLELRRDLRSASSSFASAYGLDLVIVVQEVSGSLNVAADTFYTENGCGVGEDQTGVMLLIDPVRDEMTIRAHGAAVEVFNEIWIDSFLTASADQVERGEYTEVLNDFLYQADVSCQAALELLQQPQKADALLSNGDLQLDLNQKVYDYASLLTDSEEETLAAAARQLLEQYQLDLAVVTILDAEGKSSMEYADDFYDYNGFGYGENHDGLLLLVDMQHRKVWLSTTGSAISMFPDARAQSITDNAASFLVNGDYFAGCSSALSSIEFTAQREQELSTIGGRARRSARRIPLYLLVAAAAGLITVACMSSRGKTARRAFSADDYLDRSSIRMLVKEDQFINSSVTRTRIETSSGGGGGGGSSTHTGSSGTSHGGAGSSF